MADAPVIEAHNLCVNSCIKHGQLRERVLQCLETKILEVARDETASTVLDVGNDAEAVVLQSENVIRVVKSLFDEP